MLTADRVCWPRFEALANERIEELRTMLERARHDDLDRLQGEIAGLRWALSLTDPPPVPIPDLP